MVELYHLCAPKRIHLQVSHVTPMLVVPAPRAFLQDHTVHQQPLQPLPEQLPREPLPVNAIRSENNAKETLSDPDYESAGNLRINTPAGYEPKEFTTEEIATIPMMPVGDINQLHDVQRELGEQDQQLWKRRDDLGKLEHKAYSITR